MIPSRSVKYKAKLFNSDYHTTLNVGANLVLFYILRPNEIENALTKT